MCGGGGWWVGRGDDDEERTREDLVYLYRRGECVGGSWRITKHQSPCGGVAKRCVQSIGRNATLILGSVEEEDVFWRQGARMACLDPKSLLCNQ
jgi:hypothetical protein